MHEAAARDLGRDDHAPALVGIEPLDDAGDPARWRPALPRHAAILPLPSWSLRPYLPRACLQPRPLSQWPGAGCHPWEPQLGARKTRKDARPMSTFLAPVSKPRNPMMKLVYAMDRRQTGKVTKPNSVYAARMPLAFGIFYGKLSRLDKKLQLPHPTALIIREQVATINLCLFCMDAARW